MKKDESVKCTAIVLAAGQGKRMQSQVQKQFLLLKQRPVLYYSLRTFEENNLISDVILVTGEQDVSYCRQEIVDKYGFHKVSQIVTGGAERYESVYMGLLAAGKCDYIFIHDGARPFVDDAILQRTYTQVRQNGACIAGMPVKDTIKIADPDGFVERTPDRSLVWLIQTPQVFAYDIVMDAYTRLMQKVGIQVTDDAMVVEQELGIKVKLVEGSYENIKITTPEDMEIAARFVEKRSI